MFELHLLNLPRPTFQSTNTQKNLSKNSFPYPKKTLLKNNSDLQDRNLLTKNHKTLTKIVTKKYKFDNLLLKRPDLTSRNNCDLLINIEKKPMFERSPESEKKPEFRPSLKANSPLTTFYLKKKSTQTLQIEAQSIQREKFSMTVQPQCFTTFDIWKLGQGINVSSKVFIIAGTYPDIRRALLQRGWIENTDSESTHFDLKWARNARVPLNISDWQLLNHFPRNFELSVKWQLYENVKSVNKVTKSNYLKFIPRSFRLDFKGSEDFLESFKAIYAVSLLQEFLEAPGKFFSEHVIIANQICKRWICEVEKQNGICDRYSNVVMNVEWKILSISDQFEVKQIFQRLMLSYNPDLYLVVKANLKRLEEVDSQFYISGKKNIWILKAGRKSRGRDIALFSNLEKFKLHTVNNNSWVVQKYIEKPLIICNKKFDIRQWVLISSSDPLTIWIYKKCYLRFSLEDYSDGNLNNLFIHLTNNSISKKSAKFINSEIKGCMWSIDQFQDWLRQEFGADLWTEQIFVGIKKIVKYTVMAIGNLGRKNSFEILGYDFMIDERMKPWLLEVNSSPAMDYSTDVTEVLVKEMLEDAIKVIVDYPDGSLDTGKFELCYRSSRYKR